MSEGQACMPIHSSPAHLFNPTNQTQPGQSKIRANNRNLSRNAKFKLSYCYTNSNSVKQKRWQAPNYLSHGQNRKRADWNKHLQWNQNILNQTVFKKKSTTSPTHSLYSYPNGAATSWGKPGITF